MIFDKTKEELAELAAKQRQHMWNLMQAVRHLLHAGTPGYPNEEFAKKLSIKWLNQAEAFDTGKEVAK